MNKMSSKKSRFNRANHLPHLARLVISSQLRRRDEPISATRAARSLRAALALSARREEPKEHLFAARGAEATRISLRWAADVLEELEKHGMLIWKGPGECLFSLLVGCDGGQAPNRMVLRASGVLPCIQKPPSQPQGAGAANVRAGAERHPVGWVPALPAGFLSNVKPRDVEEAHRATLWPNRRPE